MFSAVFSPLNSWCVLVPWHDGVNFWSLGLFLGGRGWSGFGVWGLRKCGVMEVKKLGRSFQSVSWFERGGRHCFFLASCPLLGLVFIIEGSGEMDQDALATSQAEFPGVWILHAICQHLADKKHGQTVVHWIVPESKQQPGFAPLSPKEGWFLFDSMLTIMMIWDTWFLACSCVGQHRCWDARRWNVDDLLNSLSSEAERTRWWVEFLFEPF